MSSAGEREPSIAAWRSVELSRFASLTLASLVIDRVFGLGLAVLMSAAFGASRDLDTYLLALAGPTVVATLVGDIIYSQLLPELAAPTGARGDGDFHAVIAFSATALVILTLLYAAGWWLSVTALIPRPNHAELVNLGLMFAPLIFLSGVSALGSTVLIANRAYAMASLRIPLASLVTVLSFVGWRQTTSGIEALIAGVLTGASVAAIVVAAAASRSLGASRALMATSVSDLVRRLSRPSLAQFIAGVLGQATTLVERLVGINLATGAISSLNYARVLVSPPLLIGQSIATASYPRFVDLTARRDVARYRELGRMVSLVAFLLVPLSILLIAFAGPLVRLIYQRGTFDEEAGAMTMISATILAIGLVPTALSAVMARFLYAERAAASVTMVSAIGFVAYSTLAVWLGRLFGYIGLATASTAANVLLMVGFLLSARRNESGVWQQVPKRRLAQMSVAGAAMAVVIWAIESLVASQAVGEIAVAAGASVAGLIAYAGVALFAGSEELSRARALLSNLTGFKRRL